MSYNIKPRTRVTQSRVWVYFKQCDGDPDKVRCNLCSVELCNKGSTSILWNHVKIKHSIDRNTLSQANQDNSSSESSMNPAKQRGNTYNTSGINNANTNSRHNLDLIDYNDLSLTSMKPLPSNSLSKNLISRLSQLSSPFARKLKFWNKKSFQVNQYDPSFKVIYLGNLGVQLWSKDESCLDKPLSTLWNNYLVNMKTEIVMRLTICNSGLKAITRQHGLTQYWSNRLVYCCSHKNYPRIFSWVYRHEGKKMRQELRCHAVFCPSPEKAGKMVTLLNQRLTCALQEFRREKKSRGSSIVSNESPLHQNCLPRTVPLRRQILAKGSANFRPPLERSKSAPKLTSILEENDYELDDDDDDDDEMEEQMHEDFEYEESFGDKDDGHGGNGDSDYDGEDLARDDEDSTHKIESNSLTTTVNEETSNSSAYATGDRSYDKQQKSNSEDPSPRCVESTNDLKDFLTSSRDNHQNHQHQHHHRLEEDCKQSKLARTTKELTNEYSSQNYNHNDSQTIQITSANTNISSSSDRRLEVINRVDSPRRDDDDDNNKLLLVNEAKNNNASNKKMDKQLEQQRPIDQTDDDTPTQEIILSWSNLVIK